MNARHSYSRLIITVIVVAILMITCSPVPAGETSAPGQSPEQTQTEAPTIETQPPSSQTIQFPPPVEGEFDCREEGSNMLCTAGGNQEVMVEIPFQTKYASYLYAINLPVGDWQNWTSEKDEFKPHRVVINFELVIDRSNPVEYINEFEPPIKLGVRYIDADVTQVGGLENLELGFWDENNKYWVSFAQHEKYQSFNQGEVTGGYVWVVISNWGDRHIGFDGD